MKNIIVFTFVLFAFALGTSAQQIPLYSQYYVNTFIYNPARTGENDFMQAFGLYRKQWTDFNGAPETRLFTLDGSLKSRKIGLGGFFFSDVTDVVQNMGGNLSYSYSININDDNRLSFGVSAEMYQTRLDFNRIIVEDPTEDIITGNLANSIGFDAAAGINYRFKGLNVGFAVPRMVQTKLRYLNNQEPQFYRLSRHYFAHASYNIPLADNKFFIEPNVMFRMAKGNVYQVDLGVMFNYKDIVWLNGAYRYDYGASFGGGVRVHQRVGVGYAYDLALNDIKNYTGGSHEFFVSVRFGKRDDKELKNIMNQIDTIKLQNDSIIRYNQEFSEKYDQQQQAIDELNEKVEQQRRALEELKESLKKEVEKVIQKIEQEQDSIRKANPDTKNFDSKGRPLPKELVQEVGDWGSVEFVYGKSDDPFFLIVASSRSATGAKKTAQQLEQKGHKTGVVYNTEKKWYYVFLQKPGDLESGLRELYEIRQKSEFKDAWIHIYR